jgi:hypothetical protein
MKAPRHILQVCGFTAEPQAAMGHSTLGLRVLPEPNLSAGLFQPRRFPRLIVREKAACVCVMA